MSLRRRTWEIVEAAKHGDTASRVFDLFILTLIFLNVIAVVVGSVESVEADWGAALDAFEVFSALVFTVEYAARLWSCTAEPRFGHQVHGRIRFAVTPMALVDLVAILPFYLPFLGLDLRSLRALRLLRILRVAKVGRYYSSLQVIKKVIHGKKEELVLSTSMMALLLIVSSSLLYYCENSVQPDAFSSIPATMWWAVATLTTVGYGDMYPTTLMGRFLASIIAVLGIGMFALPTAVLGAGFVEALQERRKDLETCPHCGKPLH